MRELEEINRWFQDEEIDLDLGLEKLKRGKELISACRGRLKNVENEFIKIKDELQDTDSSPLTVDQEPAPKQASPKAAPAASIDDDDDLPF